MGKPFDPELYRQFDGTGKYALALHLSAEGYWVQIRENFKADLASLRKMDDLFLMEFHEVETSRVWKGGPYSYPEIRIPMRKKKLVDADEGKPLYFWFMALTQKEAFTIPSSLVNDKLLAPRIVMGREEWFYCIPREQWTYVELKGGK
jgi:hypothetical protein